MKILQIIHGYPPEYNAGSEVYTQSISNELSKSHDVVIFSREENDYQPDFTVRETLTETGIRHFRINMARGKDGYNHPEFNHLFLNVVKSIKPEVAHIGHLNHLSTGIVDVLKDLRIPMLYTLHDFWLMCPRGQFLQRNFNDGNHYALCDKQENSLCAKSCYSMYNSGIDTEEDNRFWENWISIRMKTTKALVSDINLFHAPSKYLMNRFIRDFRIPPEKIFYLDYGFPVHYLRPAKHEKNDSFKFAYIGTHTPAKGINLLIEAFNQLSGNVELKIFGRTNGQNTNALVQLANKGICKVEFCGEYQNQDLTTKVFNRVDCIVVPSIWGENSPLVIHEAQACHIPVITADYGGMQEYVKENYNGLLFKHRDSESLRERMQYAANHPELMRKLGNRGYLFDPNGDVLSVEDHCRELVSQYQKLICNGN